MFIGESGNILGWKLFIICHVVMLNSTHGSQMNILPHTHIHNFPQN